MTSKLWVFRDIDPGQRATLAKALSISPATASLLLARGVTTPDEATAWMTLHPRTRSVFDPRHRSRHRSIALCRAAW